MQDTLPFTLLTGFLGSGKTTLLNRLVAHPHFRDSLVIVNELSELGLDGMRLTHVDTEYVVLDSGCVCCTTHADLTNTVARSLFRREHGLLPPFRRFVLETTGAADPYALVAAFGARGNLSHLCHLEMVLTTVDGILGEAQLDEHPEALAHVLAADHLLVTKVDLRTTPPLALEQRLNALNPLAVLTRCPTELDLDAVAASGLRDPTTNEANWERWLRLREASREQHDAHLHDHDPSNIQVLNVVLERKIDFRAWCQWVATYVQRYGKRILRLKAILHTDAFAHAIAFDAVRDVVHAPVELNTTRLPDRLSRVVLLCRDIPPLELRLTEASLRETQLTA